MTETVKAYAKINLHLDICGIRDDGYHDVETVMQTVSLCDNVSVTLVDGEKISCECDVCGVPTDDKNIAVRAARLFFERAGIKSGAYIKIEKRIPMSAGLAGGSTDAAATLRALNKLCGNRFSTEELCGIGSLLGADVPFCIVGGCAYSDGRGDLLHSFPVIPSDTVFLVACGGEGVSTPWAYRLMDEVHDNFSAYEPRGIDALKNTLLSEKPNKFSSLIFNVFEKPVLERRPIAQDIKRMMIAEGAKAAMMSGSGPSVFGIFECEDAAKRVENEIKSAGFFACVCTPAAV